MSTVPLHTATFPEQETESLVRAYLSFSASATFSCAVFLLAILDFLKNPLLQAVDTKPLKRIVERPVAQHFSRQKRAI